MLPHYRGEFRSSKCRTNLEENTNKKCHINQLSFHSYQQKSHEQSLSLPSLLFCRSMKGVQTVKKHKNLKKVIAAFCRMLGIGWTTASLTMQLTSGVSVFAHVWEKMLDTLSNFCDNNNIHSAI